MMGCENVVKNELDSMILQLNQWGILSNMDICSWTVVIGLIFVLGLLAFVYKKISRIRFFKSQEYLSAKECLADFDRHARQLLTGRDMIHEEKAKALVENVRQDVGFLRFCRWELPNDVVESMKLQENFPGDVTKHDEEVEFLRTFFVPFTEIFSKDNYIPFSVT